MILDICVTSACNLGCLYCSEGKGTIDQSRILNSKIKINLQEIINFIERFHVDKVGFWGGEPFLNFSLCKQLMEAKPNLEYLFYSNGTYVEKYLKDLIHLNNTVHKLIVQISYDGKPINDRLRLTKNHSTTSDQAVNALKLLKDNNIETCFKSTVTADTFKYLFESFKDVISYGVTYNPTPDCFNKYDESKWFTYYNDLRSNLLKIAGYIYKHDLSPSLFRWFTDDRAICQCGDGYVALDVDGYIFPCHSAMYSNLDHKIGSIRDIDIDIKLKNSFIRYKKLNQKLNCTCDARFCMKCPIGAYQLNDGSYENRYTTKNIDMCKVFTISDQVYRSLLYAKR